MGYVICYPSEIILANLANLSMCHLTFPGTSTACTWGIRGIFFSDTIFCALLPLVLLCCFVVVILPTTIATLILRIFWNDRMTACVLATSAQTICITPPSKVTVTSYLYYDQSAPHTSIAAIEFTRPPWLKMPPPQSK